MPGKPQPYPIVIADRRVNRLPEPKLTVCSSDEDVNFPEDGLLLAVSEEDKYDVHIVDCEKPEIILTCGVWQDEKWQPGSVSARRRSRRRAGRLLRA